MRQLKAIRVLTAAAKGWKVRKIMQTAREVINIKRELAEIGYEQRRALLIESIQAQSKILKQLKVTRS